MSSQDIKNLIFTYALEIDKGHFDKVAALFREGEIVTAQGTFRGYEEILALYQASTRLYEDGTPKTRHITTNLALTIDADRASCSSYFTVLQALPEFPLQPIISGSYEDEFIRVESGWRFLRRHMYPDLLGDLSRHLLFDAAEIGN